MLMLVQIILCYIIATARWARHRGKHMSYSGVVNDTVDRLDEMKLTMTIRVLQVLVTGMVVMLLLFLAAAVFAYFRF